MEIKISKIKKREHQDKVPKGLKNSKRQEKNQKENFRYF